VKLANRRLANFTYPAPLRAATNPQKSSDTTSTKPFFTGTKANLEGMYAETSRVVPPCAATETLKSPGNTSVEPFFAGTRADLAGMYAESSTVDQRQ